MRALDKVIGYSSIKEELYRIVDALKNEDKYKAMGVSEPKGLMLIGDPGVGKTLLAECIIEEIGRKSFVIRKTRSDGEFINYIKNTFEEAKKYAPSVILIDDMDRFENNDKEKVNGEAYIAIQALIDEIKDYNVYVIATVNDEILLPESLVRDGRFDKKIYMRAPRGEDAVNIVKHYLKDFSYVGNVDVNFIAKILDGRSCATLKNVINEAGIRAGYKNKEKIDMDDILSASLRVIFEAPESLNDVDYKHIRTIACHEAGHAVIKEVLEPGSVNIVTVLKHDGDVGGITSSSRDDNYYNDIDFLENNIVTLLGGKAATELIYGKIDVGCSNDIDRAFSTVNRIVGRYSGISFRSHYDYSSEPTWANNNREKEIEFKMQEYYNKSKRILAENREFLAKMIDMLVEKKTITYMDIKKLRGV